MKCKNAQRPARTCWFICVYLFNWFSK